MEQMILFSQENVPEIITYAFSILCYILYFIIKSRVSKSGKNLRTLVKEKISYIDTENSNLMQNVKEDVTKIVTRDIHTNRRLESLELEILDLKKQLKKQERMLISMIEEDAE